MPLYLTHSFRCLGLFLSVALPGCASLDKYSFETFARPKQTLDNYNPEAGAVRSDMLALHYADYVAKLLEGRSTGARITRETSDSLLVTGAALAGAQETLGIAVETVAGMGVGAVVIRELQGIFNARGRSEAFADAAYLIRQAQSEFRQYNPNPSPIRLTENGAILVSRVDAALHAARKTLNGRLPGLIDLQQATQPMTRDGARREGSGTPQTIFTAAGDKPGQTTVAAAQMEAAVNRAVSKFNRRPEGKGDESNIRSLTLTAFQSDVEVQMGKLNSLTMEEQMKAAYKGVFGQDSTKPMEEQRQDIYNSLNSLKNAKPANNGTMSQTQMDELNKIKNALP